MLISNLLSLISLGILFFISILGVILVFITKKVNVLKFIGNTIGIFIFINMVILFINLTVNNLSMIL